MRFSRRVIKITTERRGLDESSHLPGIEALGFRRRRRETAVMRHRLLLSGRYLHGLPAGFYLNLKD